MEVINSRVVGTYIYHSALTNEITVYIQLRLKNTIIDKMLTYVSETWTQKQLNIFEMKLYRRVLGPVYENKKKTGGYWPIKGIYPSVKKTYYNRNNKVK